MTKSKWLIGFMLGWSVSSALAAFLPATDDIPLMEGIELSDTTDFSFDTPAGQILIFDGTTQNQAADIRRFYDKTLAALGWQKKDTDTYHRGADDVLQLSFPEKGRVRFDVMLNGAP